MIPASAEPKSVDLPTPMRRPFREQIWFFFAALVIVALVCIETRRLLPPATGISVLPEIGHGSLQDTDIQIIYHALQQKTTFLSTFTWWHEKWAGPFRYWRPLTSQVFWLEYHAFGPLRYDRWMGAMAVSHLCFTLLLVVLIVQLAGNRWVGLWTAYLFAGARVVGPLSAWIFGVIPCTETTVYWKNEPEVWAGICAVSAMLCARSQKWGWAVAAASASICFKESGWLTWPLVFITLIPEGRYKAIPRWVYGAGATVSIVLFALRSGLGTDVYAGAHTTQNVNWLDRYWIQVSGSYLSDLTSVYAPLAIWSLALLLLISWRGISIILRTVLIAIVFCACSAWWGIAGGADISAGISSLLDWDISLQRWIFEFVYLVIALCLIRDRVFRQPALVLTALIALSALPLIASVLVGSHTLYLTYGLQSGLVALAFIATGKAIANVGRNVIQTKGLFFKP